MSRRNNINEEQFVKLANELNYRFPDLDLRFNLKSGSNQVRYVAAAVSSKVHSISLDDRSPGEMLHQAIFNIKEIARLYDA